MTHRLHLPPEEIERRCLANLKTYEGALFPNDGTRAEAIYWAEMVKAIHAYQEGKIEAGELPLTILEMGWNMPSWGYRRD